MRNLYSPFYNICSSSQSAVIGVESHPVDPEPKPNFYCESGIPKVVQGVHRDDRLKMTIKRAQSPISSGGQYSYHGEKRGDGRFIEKFIVIILAFFKLLTFSLCYNRLY